MEAHMQGREIVLVFNEDLGAALGKACEHDADSDAVHLAKAAMIVRRELDERYFVIFQKISQG